VFEAPRYEAVWKSENEIQRIINIAAGYRQIVNLSTVPLSRGSH
jgi:hypothetical protein